MTGGKESSAPDGSYFNFEEVHTLIYSRLFPRPWLPYHLQYANMERGEGLEDFVTWWAVADKESSLSLYCKHDEIFQVFSLSTVNMMRSFRSSLSLNNQKIDGEDSEYGNWISHLKISKDLAFTIQPSPSRLPPSRVHHPGFYAKLVLDAQSFCILWSCSQTSPSVMHFATNTKLMDLRHHSSTYILLKTNLLFTCKFNLFGLIPWKSCLRVIFCSG